MLMLVFDDCCSLIASSQRSFSCPDLEPYPVNYALVVVLGPLQSDNMVGLQFHALASGVPVTERC